MRLQHTPTLASDLSSSFILLDTCTLINASNSDEYLSLLSALVNNGASLATVPSVEYEFTRISRTIGEYNKQLKFMADLRITTLKRAEETIDNDMRIFLIAYNKSLDKRPPSYTDSLLCATVYKYRSSKLKLLTSNHKDIPLGIFDRKELITIDMGSNIITEALYEYSESKFGKILDKLERE